MHERPTEEVSVSRSLPIASLALVVFVSLVPALALAQPAAADQFTAAVVAPPAEPTDETDWTLGVNGTFNYGNTRSIALGATTHFYVRRDVHAFTLDLAFTYGAASVRDANGVFGDWNANAQNFNGAIRYDVFLDTDDALFAVVRGTNNPFAGLDFRFQGQLGYMRNFFNESHPVEGHDPLHQRFWGEIGADVTYDDRYPNPLCSAPPTGVTVTAATCAGSDGMSYLLPGDELQPSARLFVGYDNHMNSDWSFITGVEGLIDLRGIDPHSSQYWGNVRINWRNTLALSLGDGLAVNVQFNFLYDGQPVPGREPVDIQTIFGLNYQLM